MSRRYINVDILIADLIYRNCLPAMVKRAINEAPTADVVEVRHGDWKRDEKFHPYCSACGENPWSALVAENNLKYCPNCGAKMDGERRENGT